MFLLTKASASQHWNPFALISFSACFDPDTLIQGDSKMRKVLLVLSVTMLCLSFFLLTARAQSDEPLKFEVGAQFTSITQPNFGNSDTQAGFGVRFSYDINRNVALEGVGNFFPRSDNRGSIAQGLAGVKAGRRFDKWGIFAKARPGIISFTDGDTKFVITGPGAFPVELQRKRLTNFALDLGGILEFYPTKRLVTRFEAGDTLIHFRERQTNFVSFDPITSVPTLIPFTLRSNTQHSFQFAAGIGWRF
jgi:hypothetical protein